LTGVTVPRVVTVARGGFSSGPAPYPPACWQYSWHPNRTGSAA
jgi:hypothetical protein